MGVLLDYVSQLLWTSMNLKGYRGDGAFSVFAPKLLESLLLDQTSSHKKISYDSLIFALLFSVLSVVVLFLWSWATVSPACAKSFFSVKVLFNLCHVLMYLNLCFLMDPLTLCGISNDRAPKPLQLNNSKGITVLLKITICFKSPIIIKPITMLTVTMALLSCIMKKTFDALWFCRYRCSNSVQIF